MKTKIKTSTPKDDPLDFTWDEIGRRKGIYRITGNLVNARFISLGSGSNNMLYVGIQVETASQMWDDCRFTPVKETITIEFSTE